ncbi:MAG: glycerophosphodiester phosphodiesterase family protein, partial [Dietzia sp.]|nr:glycerophosphodiester phosphodiesterase family protein [Dietzia sp.]
DDFFVHRAPALGQKVIPWTVNDPDPNRAQIATGVDGIITDYPALLRAVMAQLGMPLPAPSHRR